MNKTKKIVPKLRFPEFENDGEWDYENGNKLFQPISNKDHNSDLPILAITQEQGAIPRELINYHVSVSKKSIESYKVVEVGDFIISLRSFQGGIEHSNYEGLCSPAYIILRKKIQLESDFYRHYFKTDLFISHLNRNLEGMRDGKMVSYKQFSEILIPKPKKGEQQKIANCLASLDNLINEEGEKLKALQNHKKGLLQNLFPQEGQKVPNYRFKEFQNDGEWIEIELHKIADRITQKNSLNKYVNVFTNSVNEGIISQSKYFSRKITSDKSLKSYYIVEKGDYVYNPRISNNAPVGPISKNKTNRSGVISPLYTVFKFKNEENSFFEYYFDTTHWQKSVKAISNIGLRFDRISIKSSDLMKIKVFHPNIKEQKKISNFLSQIDIMVSDQKSKITQTELYKTGLIQVLFPEI